MTEPYTKYEKEHCGVSQTVLHKNDKGNMRVNGAIQTKLVFESYTVTISFSQGENNEDVEEKSEVICLCQAVKQATLIMG